MGLLTVAVVTATPFLYTMGKPLPAFLRDYLNGNGHPYYFSIVPWIAFALIGVLTFGYAVLQARQRGSEERFFSWVVGGGIFAYAIGLTMNLFPILEYGFFDYSLTSPQYFLIRIGLLSIVLYSAYRWSRCAAIARWSPMRAFGQASLLIYWAHMELVYGKPVHAFEHALDIRAVLMQLLWLIPAMLIVARARQYGFLRLATDLAAMPVRWLRSTDNEKASAETFESRKAGRVASD